MRINEYFDRVVVINLDRKQDRMEILGKQLDGLGIQYERFSAIEGKERGISQAKLTAIGLSVEEILALG